MSDTLTPDVFCDGPFKFLEGPRWHDGHLWFSDMMACTVYCADHNGQAVAVADVPDRPSGLGFLSDGTPVVASMRDRKLYRILGGQLEFHADVSGVADGDINDMLVDEDGYAYVGNFGFDFWATSERTALAKLALVSPDGTEVFAVAGDLHFPNGMVQTSGGRLIVAETHSHRLTSFRINPDRTLSDRQPYADVPGAAPDGLAIDADDGVWVAAADQSRFFRIEDGGRTTHEIDVAPHLAVACAVGGPDGDLLYCLTTEPSWKAVGKGTSTARVLSVRLP